MVGHMVLNHNALTLASHMWEMETMPVFPSCCYVVLWKQIFTVIPTKQQALDNIRVLLSKWNSS